jgi:serine/threonine-protein kinase ULK/ATG1
MLHNRIYKIADFGLAKIIESFFDKMNLSVKGTPLYMAPELIK